ncbi:MAG TPA: NADH-quinone oxidoreductase subunit NuoK [Armatimonadota bacterium]|nr:NADH-quinone oxidoreductase subunit NuoK [Armatimonadota bacterium]HOJ23332.1 NADH-quinone oxidoreductase subunit NuoK [Armatimonadota bacterium]HOM83468.1 NADH-quinone oxidoreductase subunit NuoK [Armatimonadota bacterium]HOQ27887.1 NADH-quinone oxidoreductase subunit NuoK [Armatimonadota bacterium]HPO73087.1 NADH-quinone oxidoreductase subunit NuoK [Armatimonadota bacterium]
MPLSWYLILAALLFCIGVYGVLARRNAIAILMSIELMLNAVNINLVAFARYTTPVMLTGQVFAIFVMMIAAAEAAVGLALVLSVYRNMRHIRVDDVRLLKW